MKIIRTLILPGLFLFGFMMSGCAHLTVPAPEAPITPIAEPVLESSVINLPIAFSVKSLADDLAQLLPKSRDGQENVLAGKLQKFLRRQAAKVDRNFLQNEYVRQQVGMAWDALQSPIKLTDDLSLLLNPQAVSLSLATEPSDTVTILISLVAKPKLVAGVIPLAPAQPLPDLSLTSGPPATGFHIALESRLSFDYLSSELTKRSAGKEYSTGGKSIVIEKVRVYGSGNRVVMAVSIQGTIKGSVYLTGVPAYDESTRTLSMRNVEYTVETQQVLAKAADWLLHTRLQENLAERATWFVGDKIDAAKDRLSSALNRDLNQHVHLKGKILDLRPGAVGMTATSLTAVFIVDGMVEMNVL